MKRVEQRRRRLLLWGFAPFEARQLSKATEYPLNHPAMKVLKHERRIAYREAKRSRVPKSKLNQEIAFMYKAEGFYEKRRYLPLRRLKQIAAIPRIAAEVRTYRVIRESEGSYRGRYATLKKAGFFDWEAKILARMEDIKDPYMKRHTFMSKPWKAMIANQKGYRMKMLAKAGARVEKEMGSRRFRALTKKQRLHLASKSLSAMLRRLYEAGKYTVYDWLKIEYRPKPKPRSYDPEYKKRARRRTDRLQATKRQAVLFFD